MTDEKLEVWWWEEPGHAYLMVPLSEAGQNCRKPGQYEAQVIADGSRYSWQSWFEGTMYAALEEDADAPMWLATQGLSDGCGDFPQRHSEVKPPRDLA